MPLFLRVVAGEEDDHHVQTVQPDLHVGTALNVCEHRCCYPCNCACILAYHYYRNFMVFKRELFSYFVDVYREYDNAYILHDCRYTCRNNKQYFVYADGETVLNII